MIEGTLLTRLLRRFRLIPDLMRGVDPGSGRFVRLNMQEIRDHSGAIAYFVCPFCGEAEHWTDADFLFLGLRENGFGVALCRKCHGVFSFVCDENGVFQTVIKLVPEEVSGKPEDPEDAKHWEFTIPISMTNTGCLFRDEIVDEPDNWFVCLHPDRVDGERCEFAKDCPFLR
jgi:hypothetical protein